MAIFLVILLSLLILLVCYFDHKGHKDDRPSRPSRPSRPPHPFIFSFPPEEWIPPEKRAGNQGESIATEQIYEILREDDLLFTNIPVSYNGKSAELDNVVVNPNGVFIIEVKSYKGVLHGSETDYEWAKYNTTQAENVYKKIVKNPIPQVKRQVYLLANYLRENNISVWVEGYAFLLHGNTPCSSHYLLSDIGSIDHVIHSRKNSKARLSPYDISVISYLLTENKI